MDLHETGDTLAHGTVHVEGGDGLNRIVGDAVGELHDAAGSDAAAGDFVGQGGLEGVEVGQLEVTELARVEAVLEGVGVAWLGTAVAGH